MTRNSPEEAAAMNNLIVSTVHYYFCKDTVTSMKLAERFADLYNIALDWHDAAASLDQLCTMRKLTHVGITAAGLNIYKA